MRKRDNILENFLGMSYTNQIKVIEHLMTSVNIWGTNRVVREYNETFGDYLEKLKLLLSFKEEYNDFNSDKRRLTRKIVLDELKDAAQEHKMYYSEDAVRSQFAYSSEYYGETKRYFEAKLVSTEEVNEFIEEYDSLNINQKRDFIEDMIFAYQRINHLPLPNSSEMLDNYKQIIQSLLGEELMIYYDKLFPVEKMRIILRVINEFKWFKIDEDYYNYKYKSVKENPKIIRLTKKETLSYCKSELA